MCESRDATDGEVLIFPDMIKYRYVIFADAIFLYSCMLRMELFMFTICRILAHTEVDSFVEQVLVKNGKWLNGTVLQGSYVFVCCHAAKDLRCGTCGPALVTRFKHEIEVSGLENKVFVSPCSHLGGHKYAGNVIIFGTNVDGKVTGHW